MSTETTKYHIFCLGLRFVRVRLYGHNYMYRTGNLPPTLSSPCVLWCIRKSPSIPFCHMSAHLTRYTCTALLQSNTLGNKKKVPIYTEEVGSEELACEGLALRVPPLPPGGAPRVAVFPCREATSTCQSRGPNSVLVLNLLYNAPRYACL